MLRSLVKVMAVGAILGGCATADASPIVFTTSGANGVSGRATFEFSASSFTVTLENLTSPIGLTAQELDGLKFRLADGGTPTLTSVSDGGILDCSGDHSYPCDPYAGVVAVNDNWAASTAAGLTTLAPLGFHPYAIINSSYTLPTSGNGNLANAEHNPFLLGPVVFTFSGQFTGVSDVSFAWGTRPDWTDGVQEQPFDIAAVPEPSSMLLLGTGLAWVGRRARRRAAVRGN